MIKEYNFTSEEEAYKEGKRLGAREALEWVLSGLVTGCPDCDKSRVIIEKRLRELGL